MKLGSMTALVAAPPSPHSSGVYRHARSVDGWPSLGGGGGHQGPQTLYDTFQRRCADTHQAALHSLNDHMHAVRMI